MPNELKILAAQLDTAVQNDLRLMQEIISLFDRKNELLQQRAKLTGEIAPVQENKNPRLINA
jgi:hypothetical protein